MDADGEVELPITNGKHLKSDLVGKNYLNYDFTVVLSHFKGHAMGGFGGALKNISIGIASSLSLIHIYFITQLSPDDNSESLETTTYTYTLDARGVVTSCKEVTNDKYGVAYRRTVNYTIE